MNRVIILYWIKNMHWVQQQEITHALSVGGLGGGIIGTKNIANLPKFKAFFALTSSIVLKV